MPLSAEKILTPLRKRWAQRAKNLFTQNKADILIFLAGTAGGFGVGLAILIGSIGAATSSSLVTIGCFLGAAVAGTAFAVIDKLIARKAKTLAPKAEAAGLVTGLVGGLVLTFALQGAFNSVAPPSDDMFEPKSKASAPYYKSGTQPAHVSGLSAGIQSRP